MSSSRCIFTKRHHCLSCAGPGYIYVFLSNAQPPPGAARPMGRHEPWPVPGARARRDSTAGGRLARAAGAGAATGSLTLNKSRSQSIMMYCKENHDLSGAGPENIYVILSNAQAEAQGWAAVPVQPPPLARARALPGAEAAFLQTKSVHFKLCSRVRLGFRLTR